MIGNVHVGARRHEQPGDLNIVVLCRDEERGLTPAVSSKMVIGIVIGVLLLDLGVQVAHISNQTRLFALSEDARSRLSSIYVFAYFVGGSLGSLIGTQQWVIGRWPAMSLGGVLFCVLATLVFYRGQRIRQMIEA